MKKIIYFDQDWMVKDIEMGVPELDKLFICQKKIEIPETAEDVINALKKYSNVNKINNEELGECIEVGEYEFTFIENELWQVDAYNDIFFVTKNMLTAYLLLKEKAEEWKEE